MIRDQAYELRELMKTRKTGCHTVVVTSGKGGVGKTTVALNLAILAARMGFRSTLLDADLGLANIHVVIDVRSKYNLSHVIAGQMELDEIIINGPAGINVVPGASGISDLADLPEPKQMALIDKLQRLESLSDILFIDTSAGISRSVINFAAVADRVLVVTTPDPAAVTDAYAIIKTVAREEHYGEMGLIVNMVENKIASARTANGILSVCQQFLNVYVDNLGYVVSDSHVKLAVRKRTPVVDLFPRSQASFCLKEIVRKVLPHTPPRDNVGFFKRLLGRFHITTGVS